MAANAGIAMPAARIEIVAKKPVLLLQSFDRKSKRRIPFLAGQEDGASRRHTI